MNEGICCIKEKELWRENDDSDFLYIYLKNLGTKKDKKVYNTCGLVKKIKATKSSNAII